MGRNKDGYSRGGAHLFCVGRCLTREPLFRATSGVPDENRWYTKQSEQDVYRMKRRYEARASRTIRRAGGDGRNKESKGYDRQIMGPQ